MLRLRARFLTAVFGTLLFFSVSSAQASGLNEYQVKAGFLFQFTKFIEWPAENMPQDTFVICVLGKNPFGGVLDEIRGEKIQGRSIEIKNVKPDEAGSCQLVFISQSERGQLRKILNAVKDKGILTVSESSGFLDQGGIINFLMRENKIRFEINNKRAQASGLKISSKLLSIASRVE